MIKSMTGFGRAERIVGGRDISVEIKSVNHRFFEFDAHVPHGYEFLERKLQESVRKSVSRGKVDVFVAVGASEELKTEVKVNYPLAAGYLAAYHDLGKRYNLRDDATVGRIAAYPGVLTVEERPEEEESVWKDVSKVLGEAMIPFLEMRKNEGSRLFEDLSSRGGKILGLVEKIEERSPQTVREYRSRLRERISQVLDGIQVDEQRILTEAAIFADRVSVTEEVVRLKSHVNQLKGLLEECVPVGRRLDFLAQEMNREANTIGSKCSDAQIAERVVDLKSEIEKIREQIQNIE